MWLCHFSKLKLLRVSRKWWSSFSILKTLSVIRKWWSPFSVLTLLTFVVMGGRVDSAPPSFPLCSLDWQMIEAVAFVNKSSSTFYEQNIIVRYLLTSLFFWWGHHESKTPTEIPSFLRVCMGCLIFACV